MVLSNHNNNKKQNSEWFRIWEMEPLKKIIHSEAVLWWFSASGQMLFCRKESEVKEAGFIQTISFKNKTKLFEKINFVYSVKQIMNSVIFGSLIP